MIDKLNGCIEDDDVLEKFNSIWDKVNADIKKESHSEPAYNKNFSTMFQPIFYNKETPKVDSNNTCLAVISLDSALKKDENYYCQGFLKECKYI